MRKLLSVLLLIQFMACLSVSAQQIRESILLNNGWKFAYGHAGDIEKSILLMELNYFTYFDKGQVLLIRTRSKFRASLMTSLVDKQSVYRTIGQLIFLIQKKQVIVMDIKPSDGNILKQVLDGIGVSFILQQRIQTNTLLSDLMESFVMHKYSVTVFI